MINGPDYKYTKNLKMKMRIDKITVKDDWYDFGGFNVYNKQFINLDSVV